jgi:hypothetical protein
MKKIEESLALLGITVTDKVTGFKGVVTSISFELYGCIQALVNPGIDKEGKIQEQRWFDTNRLRIGPETIVMENPFNSTNKVVEKGPDKKPIYPKV